MPRTKDYSVEVADVDDIFELTILAKEAYGEDIIDKEHFRFNTKKVGNLFAYTIPSDQFLVLKLTEGEEIVGYFLATISECFFALETQTLCLSWFIRPEHRSVRNAFSLLKTYEKWGKDSGAVVINMIDIRDHHYSGGRRIANTVFERLGYEMNETMYAKGVG